MGGSKSSKSSKEETNITTTTTTTVGDIGLTGANAVALADVIQQGGLESQFLQGQNFQTLITTAGESLNQQSKALQRQAELASANISTLGARAAGADTDAESRSELLTKLAFGAGGLAALVTIVSVLKK